MSDDPFAEFAQRYDRMRTVNETRRDFFRLLLDRYYIKSALDCACGTGDDLILLHTLGARASGSDISPAMLAVAREKLAAANIDLPLNEIDFRELHRHFDQYFDAVLCLTTALPQLPDEEEVIWALKSMRSVLNPAGVLILSQGLTDKQVRRRARFFTDINTPEFSRVMVIDYHEKLWEVHVLDLSHTENECDFKVDSFRYLLLLKDDYERVLKAAGFGTVEFFGSLALTPYDKQTSDHMIVVAHR